MMNSDESVNLMPSTSTIWGGFVMLRMVSKNDGFAPLNIPNGWKLVETGENYLPFIV